MESCGIFVCKTREKEAFKTDADVGFWGGSDGRLVLFFNRREYIPNN